MLKSCSGGILQPLCPAVSSDTLCSCNGHGRKEDAVLQPYLPSGGHQRALPRQNYCETSGSGVPQLSLKTYTAKDQRTRWKSTCCVLLVLCMAKFFLLRYRFIPQINHRSSLFSGPWCVLLSFLSTLLFHVMLTGSFWEPIRG